MQPVTGASHCLDESIVAAGLKRLTQPPDVNIDGALFDKYMIAPYLVEQLHAAINALGVRHEKMQQLEFSGAQVELGLIARHTVGCRIELQTGDFDQFISKLG